jgi:PIN domain nuclease of toxin-antitoxin system
VVIDSSALLAMLQREPGWERVVEALALARISAVNWSEVAQKALVQAVDIDEKRRDLEALGLEIVPFDAEEAEVAASLWSRTKSLGLSLADRACLATGIRRKARVLTTERAWTKLDVGVRIETIRG